MKTNFTLRDFFTFLLVGIIFLLCIGIPFYKEVLSCIASIVKYQVSPRTANSTPKNGYTIFQLYPPTTQIQTNSEV
jgi:hypothetical protein